jgi:carnitine O-acetyltransferase
VLKKGEDVPEMFEDPVVKRASHWVLSTSALFSKYLREYGWGEVREDSLCLYSHATDGHRALRCAVHKPQVVPDGFGIAYITGFDGTSFPNGVITLNRLN